MTQCETENEDRDRDDVICASEVSLDIGKIVYTVTSHLPCLW